MLLCAAADTLEIYFQARCSAAARGGMEGWGVLCSATTSVRYIHTMHRSNEFAEGERPATFGGGGGVAPDSASLIGEAINVTRGRVDRRYWAPKGGLL